LSLPPAQSKITHTFARVGPRSNIQPPVDPGNSFSWAGAAYVFVRNGTNWSQQAYLKASNTGANDVFGFSVAVSGDTIVVTGWGEASNSTGVNGNQSNNSFANAGAAYVF